MSLKDKTMRACLHKADKQACGWLGTKSSPTVIFFKEIAILSNQNILSNKQLLAKSNN